MKLIIAEKPSVAATYASVLGASTKKSGYYEGNGCLVSWCVGHLLQLAKPEEYSEKYKKWNKGDLPISPVEWVYLPSNDSGRKQQLKTLASLMKRADVSVIINGADAGREGELIFRLVYEYAKSNKPIQRLWISSMEEKAVKDGFNNLRPGAEYDNLNRAAKCRDQADWLVGMNLTRLFSTVYNSKLRVGRVQTPTLAMVVERHNKVVNFVREPFYVVALSGMGFTAERERLAEKGVAESIAAKCSGATATILSIVKEDKTLPPPKLFDLTTLQREANQLLGLTAAKTLDIAQTLYESKLITYPRTDSRYITEDMAGEKLNELIRATISVMALSDEPNASNFQSHKQIVNNSKVTDHHAILPTMSVRNADLGRLSGDERNVLLMVCTRLISAVSERHSYAETTVTVECAGESFVAKGKSVTDNGWKHIEDEYAKSVKQRKGKKEDDNETSLPSDLREGAEYAPSVEVDERFTSPPKHYTEATLLSAMENAGTEGVVEEIERKGIGTPATRAGIIEKLIKDGFMIREKKRLLPTEQGINLVNVLPDKVKSPLLTAEWENELKRVERGHVTQPVFMKTVNEFVSDIVQAYGKIEPKDNNPFGGSDGGETIGACPRCGASVTESPKAYSCERSRSKECGFALWKDNKFFMSQGKKITKSIAKSLVSKGSVYIKDLKSQKSGKTYAATILLDDNKDGYVNFTMKF